WIAGAVVAILLAGVGVGSAMSRRAGPSPPPLARPMANAPLVVKPILIIPQPVSAPEGVATEIEGAPAATLRVSAASRSRNDVRRGVPGARSAWRRRWIRRVEAAAPAADAAAPLTTVRAPPPT